MPWAANDPGVIAWMNAVDTQRAANATAVAALPTGTLSGGYAAVTANQATITTEVDLTGLTVTVTVGAGRRIRISADLAFVTTVSGGLPRVRIKEGATQLQERSMSTGSTSAESIAPSVVLTPSTGAHTYKLTALLALGSGSMSLSASATAPAYILVEDIGV
jgi:hypothetical protein